MPGLGAVKSLVTLLGHAVGGFHDGFRTASYASVSKKKYSEKLARYASENRKKSKLKWAESRIQINPVTIFRLLKWLVMQHSVQF